jgi:ubiquinone/menaquinone biosynthesis C-methylase UbiE
MTTEILSERQLREKEYYDEYAKSYNLDQNVDFSPIDGPIQGTERRPWNSYWDLYEMSILAYKPGHKILDFGSGPGENALRFARVGYQVEGFDISDANVAVSNRLFDKYQMSDKANFQVAGAEELPYADNTFETIVGIDILHHVDIPRAVRECKRVLKSGGVAIFREPIEVPLLDWIRNTKLVRLFAPKEKSFELHITEDERKLNQEDVRILKEIFPQMEIKRYLLLARFDKFIRDGEDPRPSTLEKIDHFLMKYIPGMKYFGGVATFILRKE